MSTLKVDAIRHNSATSDAITTAADGTCTARITGMTGGGGLSHRNLIINGDFRIAQRASSSASNGYTSVDRWKMETSNITHNSTKSHQSLTSSDTPYTLGFRKFARIALAQAGVVASNSAAEIQQRIEAQDIATSGWNYGSASSNITLQFWFRCSTNQTFYGYLYTFDGTNQLYCFSFTASGNNTWTKITKTIPGNSNLTFDNDNGPGLQLKLIAFYGTDYTNNLTLNQWGAFVNGNQMPDMASTWLTAGASTFDITGVQLEVGDTATTFEHRSIGEELHRCQRYFYMCADGTRGKSGTNRAPICTGAMYNTNNFNGVVNFPVEMRTTPSLYKVVGSGYFRIWGNGGSDGCNDVVLEGSSPQCGIANIYDGLSQTSGSATWATTDNAACRLGFQAEL